MRSEDPNPHSSFSQRQMSHIHPQNVIEERVRLCKKSKRRKKLRNHYIQYFEVGKPQIYKVLVCGQVSWLVFKAILTAV